MTVNAGQPCNTNVLPATFFASCFTRTKFFGYYFDDYQFQWVDKKQRLFASKSEKYLLSKGDILVARTGATYGKTMLFNEKYQAVYASFLIRIRFKEKNILPAYYWHFAQSGFYWEQATRFVAGGAQPQFNANVLKLIKIPIPPISKQKEIVAILDKFDTLVNDISIGLPAEITARKKQYEYYRNQLLTFTPLNSFASNCGNEGNNQ